MYLEIQLAIYYTQVCLVPCLHAYQVQSTLLAHRFYLVEKSRFMDALNLIEYAL